MKTLNRVIAMAMFAVAAFIGNADVTTNRVYSTNHTVGDVEMTPVQQLVYAVTNAPADGVVLIEPGTYTFTGAEYGNVNGTTTNLLYSTKSGVTIIGDTDTSRKDWTLGSEPVIIDLNGKGVLFRFTSSGCSVRNIAITSSASVNYSYCIGNGASKANYTVITNCTIRGISSSNTFALWIKFQDCLYTGMTGNGFSRFDVGAFNCDFIENTTSFYHINAYGCTFRGNSGKESLVVNYEGTSWELVDCKFISNANTRQIVRAYNIDQTIEDCEFSGNTAPRCCNFYNTSGKSNDVVVSGCKFTGNKTILRPTDNDGNNPLVGTLTVANCSFVANAGGTDGVIQLTSARAAQIADCTFEKNTNTLIKAELKESERDSVEVSGCTFSSNVIGTADYNSYGAHVVNLLIDNKTNNFTSAAAAQSRFIVKDTTFEGSHYVRGDSRRGMAEVFGVTATGCTFRAFNSSFPLPPNYNTYAMSAYNSFLQCCDISGGDLGDCVVDRCTLHDIGSPAYACFRDYCRVTNSLVTNCQTYLFTARQVGDGGRHDAEFVNCTFAGNNALTYYSRCAVGSANDLKFVNCLFNANTNGNSVATDFSMGVNSVVDCWTSKVSFDHCFYGKFEADGNLTAARFAAKTNGVDTLSLCTNPGFVKDSRPEAEAPYWSLSHRSPLLGKGNASIWTAEDIDLAGKLRLKDGQVDPGCYQCWLRAPGMMMIVR